MIQGLVNFCLNHLMDVTIVTCRKSLFSLFSLTCCRQLVREVLIDLVFQVVFYFLKQIKNNLAWQRIFPDTEFFRHLNKLIHVEKILSLLPRAFCSLRCLLVATAISKYLNKPMLFLVQMAVILRAETLVKHIACFI